MAIQITHGFVSEVADGDDPAQVQPSHWNAAHALTSGSGVLLGRTTAGAGTVQEITVDPPSALAGGVLTLPAAGGTTVASIPTTGGTTTLTSEEHAADIVVATGALTSAPTFVVPATGRWAVINRTTNSGITQWNPSDTHAGITLSNGNLTATSTQNNNQKLTRTVPFSSGKVYWEVTAVSGSVTNLMVGVKNTVSSTSDYVGNTGGAAYQSGGQLVNGSSAGSGWPTFSAGDVICVAVDCTNKRIWFRKNALSWNNNAANDPATNTGGADIATIFNVNGNICAAISEYTTGIVATANFGLAGFSYTVPSGFSALSGATYPLTVKTAAGTGATVSQGRASAVLADGTNVVLENNDPAVFGLEAQGPGVVLAGPRSGAAATPAFRTLGANDAATVYSLGTASGTVATDASLASIFTLTLNGNGTLANPTNLKAGARYCWVVSQDATGGRTLAYGSAFKWVGGAPVLASTASAVSRIEAVCPDGAILLASYAGGFA